MKILSVLRASTVQQDLESQKEDMLKFCKEKGFDEIVWIETKGASARKANKQYLQMLEDIKNTIINNDIKYVAFWHLNRLGRIESYIQQMKEWFIQNKIQVYIKNPSLQLLNEDGTLNSGTNIAFSIFAAMVSYDTEELMEKTKRTRWTNAKKNKFQGGKDVKTGYVLNDDRYIIVDTDDYGYKLVQLIFNEYATGKYSMRTLYKELKERGYNKPSGKPLDQQFIKKILSDESYIGGCSKEVVTERRYTPIISKEVFDKCTSIRIGNRAGDLEKYQKHTFLGIKIIKCNCCGNYIVGNKSHYRCFRAWTNNTDRTCTNRTNLKIEVMDAILWRIACTKHMTYLMEANQDDKIKFQEERNVLIQKIKTQKELMQNQPKKKIRIQEGYENGIYSKVEYLKKIAVIDEQAKEIIDTILSLENEIKKIDNILNGNTDIDAETERLVNMMFSTMDEDLKEKKEIVNKYIKEATYNNVGNYQNIKIYDTDNNLWEFNYYPNKKVGEKVMKVYDDGIEKEFIINGYEKV